MASQFAPLPLDDYVEHGNRTPSGDGVVAIGYDRAADVIRVVGNGLWSVAQVDAYHAHLHRLATTMRRGNGAVRVIADLRAAAIQPPEVADRIRMHNERLLGRYRIGDRFAVVVATSLMKMQLRRMIGSPGHAFFISHPAAETWLRAFR